MTIRTTRSGPYLLVEASDTLVSSDLQVLFDALEASSKVGRFVVLTDTTALKSAPRSVISEFADLLKKKDYIAPNWLGDAVVVSSPAVRFVLSTLLMIAPLPTEVKAFDSRLEAQRWCAGILRRAGLDVPPQLKSSA
uniref:STAS/SEC14 domain-containing protein n=1 Tax=Phaselicystis flava TaxID=525924 RepID=A0A3S7V0B3_9BACT|nr:hypothetical protein [Phaselicystis flava]